MLRSVLLICCFLQSTIALAETIYLKNGTVLRGSIVEMSEMNITLATSDLGTVVIKRRSVAAISDIATPPPTPVAPPISRYQAPTPPPQPDPQPVPRQVPSQLNQEIHIQQPQSTAPTIQPTTQTLSKTHSQADKGHLHSSVGIGYTSIMYEDDQINMPTLHVDLLSYRSPSGSSFAVFGLAGENSTSRYSAADIKADWALSRTRFAGGASTLSFGFSGGVSSLDIDETDYYYQYYYYWDDTSTSESGPAWGAQLVYNYLSDNSFGFQVGVSGLSSLSNNTELVSASGFGGISIVF